MEANLEDDEDEGLAVSTAVVEHLMETMRRQNVTMTRVGELVAQTTVLATALGALMYRLEAGGPLGRGDAAKTLEAALDMLDGDAKESAAETIKLLRTFARRTS